MTLETLERQPLETEMSTGQPDPFSYWQPKEPEPIPEGVITLDQILDYYYPKETTPGWEAIHFTAKEVLHCLDDTDKYYLKPESILPILSNCKYGKSENPKRVPDMELAKMEPDNQADKALWQFSQPQGLQLTFLTSYSGTSNAKSDLVWRFPQSIISRNNPVWKKINPTVLGLPDTIDNRVFLLNKDAGHQLQIKTWGQVNSQTINKKLYLVIREQESVSGGGKNLSVNLVCDTRSDAREVKYMAPYRSLLEINFHGREEDCRDAEQRVSFNNVAFPWIKKWPHSYAAIKQSDIVSLNQSLTAEFDDLITGNDPHDVLDMVLVAGRLVYLSSLQKDNSRSAIDPAIAGKLRNFFAPFNHLNRDNSENITPFDRVFAQLLERGENYREEIEGFINNLTRAYQNDWSRLLLDLDMVGLGYILPNLPIGQEIDSSTVKKMRHVFNPLTDVLWQQKDEVSRDDFVQMAWNMGFNRTLVRENIGWGQRPFSCTVFNGDRLHSLRYDRTLELGDIEGDSVVSAINTAAEGWKNPGLDGSIIVMPFRPTLPQQMAIRHHPGIKAVVYALPHPYDDHPETDILGPEYDTIFGKGPKVYAGFQRREMLKFVRGYPELAAIYFPDEKPANYANGVARNYADAVRAGNFQAGGSIEHRDMSEMLGDIREMRVLDVGFGPGEELEWFHNRGAKVYGIEKSDDHLDIFREVNSILREKPNRRSFAEDFNLQQASALAIPYADNSMDIILAKFVLNEIKDKKAAFREFYRVLKPGGKLLIIFHTHESQMLFPDAESHQIKLDMFSEREVEVEIAPGVTVREPVSPIGEYLSGTIAEMFDLKDFREGRDETILHQKDGQNVAEYRAVGWEKRA